MQRLRVTEGNAERLFGTRDENLRYLEERLGVTVNARGTEISLSGDERSEQIAVRMLESFDRLLSSGGVVGRDEYQTAVRVLEEDLEIDLVEFFLDADIPGALKRLVVPRNLNQRLFIKSVCQHDFVFGVGPAGTGKTYLAVAMAVAALLEQPGSSGSSSARPAVEAGEKLGFLPGDLVEKINPYLRPLYDALHDMLDYDQGAASHDRHRGHRDRAPGLHARPHAERRLRHPRRGPEHHPRADEDVPHPAGLRLEGGGHRRHHPDRSARPVGSGLVQAVEILDGEPGFAFLRFTHRDVVRHRLVQQVVDRYDRWEAAKKAKGRPS